MQSLIILRGLPGSGKSTLAKELSENGTYPVFSVDDFFRDSTGNYHFEFEKNHLAYKQCEQNTRQSMSEGTSKIFIDNVFSLEWEIEPYFKLASEFNYRVFVLTVENRQHFKNIHGINDEQIRKMAAKYQVILF
ncbi:MAG: AAA family ATPase [Bacteroidetes bacterium]|nr:AAA family ATPase [Bacteroidota bacterium]